MKHKATIIFVLLGMFLVTQFIGLYVVDHYSQEDNDLPYGMNPPGIQEDKDFYAIFPSIIMAFIIAIVLFFLLTKFKIEFVLKIWFLVVIVIALGISFTSFIPKFQYTSLLVLALAIPLALIKVFKRNVIVHNFTELLIYPGIAAIFVPLLNIWTTIALLVLISLYDMWAVWKSKIMQKMSKYQMNTLKIFSGFFVPYLSKQQRQKMKKLKKKLKKSELKKKKIKVNIAILGGGDVIFPIITAGVMLKTLGLWPAILVIIGAVLGLGYLFLFSKKKKFYPAMPFITAGMFLGILFSYLIF